MNCPNCGAENPDKSKWCGKCGKELKRKKVLLLISSIMLIIYSSLILLQLVLISSGEGIIC